MENWEKILQDKEREHEKYLYSTFLKMKTFNMKTSGVKSVDDAIKARYGDWRKVQ